MENQNLTITENSKAFLLETAKWARFISIVTFVGLGIFALIGILQLFSIVPFMNEGDPSMSKTALSGPFLGILYLIMIALYFFPTMYLFNFSTSIKTALELSQEKMLELGFENLKSLFRFIGILMIISLSFYVMAIFLLIMAIIFK